MTTKTDAQLFQAADRAHYDAKHGGSPEAHRMAFDACMAAHAAYIARMAPDASSDYELAAEWHANRVADFAR